MMENKVVLITGGNSGIGRATALLFSRRGATVVIAARRVPEGEQTVKAIEAEGGKGFFNQADVSQQNQVESLVDYIVQRFGRIDYAFNNAGVGSSSANISDFSVESWQQVLDVNLTGVFICMKYELKQMEQQGFGVIINNASAFGFLGAPTQSAYCATKHGVLGLTKSAALEYGNRSIRVNAVCPGWIMTPLIEDIADLVENVSTKVTPLGHPGSPLQVAEMVVWLCSDAASYVTGQSFVIDGGLTTNNPLAISITNA
jgi:NAD(P)-dependent dehydrogenase (short-subunit alcohol dehydrogenase family)